MALLSVLKSTPNVFLVFCPGCKRMHQINAIGAPNAYRPQWTFNGDHEKPSFHPSYLMEQPWKDTNVRCHSYIKNGEWQFLGDCTHDLKGKTVPMVDTDTLTDEDYDDF